MMWFSALQTPSELGWGGRGVWNFAAVVLVGFWGVDLRHLVKAGRGKDVTGCLWPLQEDALPPLPF